VGILAKYVSLKTHGSDVAETILIAKKFKDDQDWFTNFLTKENE